MKYVLPLSLILMSFTACFNKKAASTHPVAVEESSTADITARGTITKIESGKDGYMATIKGQDGNTYIAVISIINLQKSGGQYRDHKVGDTITVQGSGWKDEAGALHIVARQLK